MMSSASSSTPIAADSALAMATSLVWSRAPTAAAGCCPSVDPSRRVMLWVRHAGPRAQLVPPPAGAAGCPLP